MSRGQPKAAKYERERTGIFRRRRNVKILHKGAELLANYGYIVYSSRGNRRMYFCGENFRICHPMNSSRSMLLQASAQEKGKPLDRSCAHETVPKQRKLSGRKPAIAEQSVRRQETGVETHGASGMQVRRTAVSTAETRRKDECVGRALPVAFGISAPSSVRKRHFYPIGIGPLPGGPLSRVRLEPCFRSRWSWQ